MVKLSLTPLDVFKETSGQLPPACVHKLWCLDGKSGRLHLCLHLQQQLFFNISSRVFVDNIVKFLMRSPAEPAVFTMTKPGDFTEGT